MMYHFLRFVVWVGATLVFGCVGLGTSAHAASSVVTTLNVAKRASDDPAALVQGFLDCDPARALPGEVRDRKALRRHVLKDKVVFGGGAKLVQVILASDKTLDTPTQVLTYVFNRPIAAVEQALLVRGPLKLDPPQPHSVHRNEVWFEIDEERGWDATDRIACVRYVGQMSQASTR